MKTTWIVYALDDGGAPLNIVARPFDLEAEAYQVMRNVSVKNPTRRYRVVRRDETVVWEQDVGGIDRMPSLVLGGER